MNLRGSRVSPMHSYVACEVGTTHYVMPVDQVQEILPPRPLTPLPHAPVGIIGAIQHRNQVVSILDLGASFGFGETLASRRKWVLMRDGQQILGVVVSQVHEVFEAPESDLTEVPQVGEANARVASQVLRFRGRMAFVLPMKAVAALAGLELADGGDE